MSYLLPHLHSGWAVDQAILGEEDRVVIIRFGHDWDPQCMQMDEILAGAASQPVECIGAMSAEGNDQLLDVMIT
jgi:hypothetical protein